MRIIISPAKKMREDTDSLYKYSEKYSDGDNFVFILQK